MEFRAVGDGRSIRRPGLEDGDLIDKPVNLKGEFSFDEVRLTGNQPGVVGEGLLRRSVLAAADLATAVLSPLQLRDARLSDVDLSNARVTIRTMHAVELLACRGIGLNVTIEQASDLYVEDCRFDYAAVRIERTKGPVVFHRCSFREATVAGDLSGMVFSECDFTAVEFSVRHADRCDLSGSQLAGARGLLTLRGAQISRGQAVSVADSLATEAGLVIRP